MSPFEALADPHRRLILDLLHGHERTAGEIVAALPLTQPGASKHLRILREAGLVRVRKDAQRRVYSLAPERLAEIDAWLAPYRQFWSSRLYAIEMHLKKEQ
jgi:DNA-binding transcriptional ArsR family regulator